MKQTFTNPKRGGATHYGTIWQLLVVFVYPIPTPPLQKTHFLSKNNIYATCFFAKSNPPNPHFGRNALYRLLILLENYAGYRPPCWSSPPSQNLDLTNTKLASPKPSFWKECLVPFVNFTKKLRWLPALTFEQK